MIYLSHFSHCRRRFSLTAATPKVGELTLKVGESMGYELAAEGKVATVTVGLMLAQSPQPRISPLALVLMIKMSLPPAPKLAVDAATRYPPSGAC